MELTGDERDAIKDKIGGALREYFSSAVRAVLSLFSVGFSRFFSVLRFLSGSFGLLLDSGSVWPGLFVASCWLSS